MQARAGSMSLASIQGLGISVADFSGCDFAINAIQP
jgi:hypothetical protein